MSEEPGCSCKFGRVLSKYDLTSFETELERKWQAPDGPGLRTLADEFNVRVLGAALEAEGETLLDGEAENLYRLLTDDDVSAGAYTQAKNRLLEHGIEPDALEADFISYQTVNRHFKNCRGLSKEEPSDEQDTRSLKNRIFALQNRTARVTEKTLEQLEQEGEPQFEERNVFVDISVSCDECGTVVPVEEFVDGAKCACYE